MKKCPKCGGGFKLARASEVLRSRYKERNIHQLHVYHCNVCSHQVLTEKGKEVLSMAEQYNLRMMRTHYSDAVLEPQDSPKHTFQPLPSHSHVHTMAQTQNPLLDSIKRMITTVSRSFTDLEKKL